MSAAVLDPLAEIQLGIINPKNKGIIVATERHEWADLADRLMRHEVRKDKDGPGYVPGPVEHGRRAAECVPCLHLLALDIEGKTNTDKNTLIGPAAPPLDDVAGSIEGMGWEAVLATSHSHEHPALVGTIGPRYRVIFRVSRPIKPEEIKPLGLYVARLLRLSDVLDTQCLEPARFYYFPACPPEREHLAQVRSVGGQPLDVDHLLQEAAAAAPSAPRASGPAFPPLPAQSAGISNERNLIDDLRAALAHLNADDYHEWISVGIALRELNDDGYGLWLEWSQRSPKFEAHKCPEKWPTFEAERTGYKAVFSKAQRAGWKNPAKSRKPHMPDGDISQLLASIAAQAKKRIDEHGEITDIVAKAPKKAVPTFPPPFRGVMADLVEKTLKASHKPQPQLSTLAALVGMAAAINGEYSTASGGRFNLYGMGVAESGTGKDKPRVMAEQVAVMGNAGILGKPGSGPGLEDAIESRRNQLVTIDEVAHLLKSVNDEKAPAHLRDIGATLLMLFSASANTYNRRVLVKSTVQQTLKTVPNPCVSLLCFSTPESIGDALTDSNCTDGLLGRLLLVPGDPEVTWRRPKCDLEMPSSVTEAVAEFKEIDPLAFAGGIQGIGSIIVQEDEGIGELLDKLGLGMEMDRRDRDHSVARSLYNRSFEKVERIAGVLAIWDNPQAPVLREDHLEWARQFVLASDAALLDFLHRHMHSGEVTKNAAKVREVLRRILAGAIKPVRPGEVEARKVPGCVARSHLLRASKLAKNDLDRTLDHMQDLGELVAATETGERLVVIHSIDMGA